MSELFSLLTVILAAVVVSFALAVPIIDILYKLKIVRGLDVDFSAVIDSRKSKAGTPVMGGLIIVFSFIILNLAFNFNSATKIPLIVFFVSALLGGLDDVLNIYGIARKVRPLNRINKLIQVHSSKFERLKLIITYPWQLYKNFFYMLGSNPGKGLFPHEKILINTLAGLAVAIWTFKFAGWVNPGTLFFPLGLSIDIGWAIIPVAILTVLVVTNAVNIADGLDGLSAGMLLPAFLSFMAIAYLKQDWPIVYMCGIAIGGIIAYLYFNIPPARVQMGDVGSLSLGTLLAVVALQLRLPFLLLIIGLPFILEFGSSLLQGVSRRVLGKRILLMAPLHHHLELKGWKEEKVVMRFWLFSVICAILGIWVYLLY